ncbi:hypothetical protein ACQFYA_02195 [Promicromonospora sp. Marseille-Q5078]
MTGREPPPETLAISGGRGLARVDADAVQGASALLDAAAERLRQAARHGAAAQGVLVRWTWAPDPLAAPFTAPDPRAVAAGLVLADRVSDAAARLELRASRVDRCALRLRLAAGLYRRTESLVEQAVGAFVSWNALAVGAVADLLVGQPAVRTFVAVSQGAKGLAGPATVDVPTPRAATPPPPATREAVEPSDDLVANLWRVVAPYADEAVAGTVLGLAGVGGLTRGAGTLSDLVDALLPASEVRVLALSDADLAGPAPGWADRPSGTVAEALARTADLYPQGSGVVGRPGVGVPAGTLAVERVSHEDGSTSWTVLIPGTQALLSPTNPFDAATDLDLMAHESADVSAAVEQALDLAGADEDEEVVLVGHSLGGIAATALAASPAFRAKHPVGGVVTAGAPTATFATPAGVPVLHLENDEELVSTVDGRSSGENPATPDRVTVGRRLLASADAADLAASGSIALAHAMPTHLRTLAAARDSGSVQVAGVTGRLERLLGGTRAQTWFFAARRTTAGPDAVLAPGPEGAGEAGVAAGLSPSSERTLR